MKASNQGIVRDQKAEDQLVDSERAQTVHRVDPEKSVSREATRDTRLTDAEKSKSRRHPD